MGKSKKKQASKPEAPMTLEGPFVVTSIDLCGPTRTATHAFEPVTLLPGDSLDYHWYYESGGPADVGQAIRRDNAYRWEGQITREMWLAYGAEKGFVRQPRWRRILTNERSDGRTNVRHDEKA